MSKIEIDEAYSGYVFMGYAYGMFEPQNSTDGQKRPYYNMFVVSPVSTFSSEDYQAYGLKAEKKRCVSADVWKDLTPGDKVRLFFDDKQRVVLAAIDG